MNFRAPDPRNRMLSAASTLAFLALAGTHFSAAAQVAAVPPKAAASAASAVLAAPVPKVAAPAPRVLSPAQQMQENAPVDDTRPEGTVTPQIMIPLGPDQTPTLKPVPGSGSRAKPSVNDTAARCEAIVDPVERRACKEGATR